LGQLDIAAGEEVLHAQWDGMGAPPAVASAVEHALRPLGVRIDALPLTPSHLRSLIRQSQERHSAAAE